MFEKVMGGLLAMCDMGFSSVPETALGHSLCLCECIAGLQISLKGYFQEPRQGDKHINTRQRTHILYVFAKF